MPLSKTKKNLKKIGFNIFYYRNDDVGSDLRSCKELLKKQTTLEDSMRTIETKLSSSEVVSQEMTARDHYHAKAMSKNIANLQKSFNDTKVRIPVLSLSYSLFFL